LLLEYGGEDRFMEMALAYYKTFNLFSLASIVIQIFLIIFFIVAIFLGRAKDGEKQ